MSEREAMAEETREEASAACEPEARKDSREPEAAGAALEAPDEAAEPEKPDESDEAEEPAGSGPDARQLKRSLRAVAQERNEARGRVRELEAELAGREEERAALSERVLRLESSLEAAPKPEVLAEARASEEALRAKLEAAEEELRRYRVEMPLLAALGRHQCADPGDALKLFGGGVRTGADGRVRFFDPDRPEAALEREDGEPFEFDDFARYVLERKPHLRLRPPAVGSATPGGSGGESSGPRPSSRRDPEAYRRYFVRRYGQDPRSLISL
jgi:hypothetical protein